MLSCWLKSIKLFMSSVTRYLDKYYHNLSCTCEYSKRPVFICLNRHKVLQKGELDPAGASIFCWLTVCLNYITIVCPYRRGRKVAFAVLLIKIYIFFTVFKWQIIILPNWNSEMWILKQTNKQTNTHTIKQKPEDVSFKQS